MEERIENSIELMKLFSFLVNVQFNKDFHGFSPTITNLSENFKKNKVAIANELKALAEQKLIKEVKKEKEFEYLPVIENFINLVSERIYKIINSGYPELYKKKGIKYKSNKLKVIVKKVIIENKDIFTNYLIGCLLEENFLNYYLDDLIEKFLLTVLYIEYCWDIPKKKEDKKWLDLVKIAEMYALVVFNVPIIRILTRWVGEEYFYPTLDSYLKYFLKKT
ncbi:MAG: hypothetical protein QXD43_01760 [Candidatus Aenigmatarchaeota archaeon]